MSIAMAPELVRTLRLRLRSDDHEAVREARRTLASALGDAADAAMTVPELVLGELIGNATRYAPGAVDLLMHVGDEAVSISVTDGGAGFSLEAARAPNDLLAESGRGLRIVQSCARSVRVTLVPGGGCCVTAVVPLAG